MKKLLPSLLLTLGLVAVAVPQTGLPKIDIGISPTKNPEDISTSLQILALLTVLSIAPAILIMTTAFTRIVIIFSFVRNALGTQNIPPNQVVIGLSLFLTLYIMAPTYTQINESALKPYFSKKIMANGKPMTFEQALEEAQKPVRAFMLKNTYESDLNLFLDMRDEHPETPEKVSLISLIPAFILSELKTAFIIGFYIFVPFVIIDLIVGSALISMGMMMLPPTVISMPAKLLVFILADGWSVLVQAIMQGFV
ncbi:MAG TPA: flagellar type III secretion system pore protein FliP [Fimbriimonadaceae bacterium]|nr:flagellar type III secretion system pore protein FliP [Fimbriimonadaceae bacterium]HRJ96592.1 flagellar type III secretion system pore protein FliP [Fimbriimonadaceae bacterium]